MSLRNLAIRLSLTDEIRNRLLEVREQLEDIQGFVATVTVDAQVQGLDGINKAKASIAEAGKNINASTSNATKSIGGLSGATQGLKGIFGEVGSAAKSAFGSVSSSVNQVSTSVGQLAVSLGAVAAGGAVAGLSYIGAASEKIRKQQLYDMLEAQKSFKMQGKTEQVKAFVEGFGGAGYTTPGEMVNVVRSAYSYGFKGEDALKAAKTAEQLAIKFAPTTGGMTGEELMTRIGREGALPAKGAYKANIAMILGVDINDKRLETDIDRKKLLLKKYGTINMDIVMNEQPWIRAQNSIEELKQSIGTALMPTLSTLADKFSEIAEFLATNQDFAWVAGMVAIGVAAVGAMSLFVGVMTPIAGVFMGIAGAIYAVATSQTVAAAASRAYAAAQWLVNVAMTANPIGIAIVAFAALAAILYAVEMKTHIVSNALAGLSKIPFFKDILFWFDKIKGGDLGALFGGKPLELGLMFAVGPFGLALKPIIGLLTGSLDVQKSLKKLFELGVGLWTRMADAIGWVYDKLRGVYSVLAGLAADLVDKIRKFLPEWAGGYTAEEKQKKYGEMLEKQGITPGKVVEGYENLEKAGAFNYEPEELGGRGFVPREGWSLEFDENKLPVRGTYNTPPTTPTITPPPTSPIPPTSPMPRPITLPFDPNQIYKNIANAYFTATFKGSELNKMMTDKTWDLGPLSDWVPVEAPSRYTKSEYAKFSDELNVAGFSSISAQHGAAFRRGGLFTGRVHPLEEIIPQAQAQKGPGPISKALEAIYNLGDLSAGGGAAGSAVRTQAGATIINNISINVDKIEKEVDADNFLFKVRRELGGLNTRNIGYLRGGSAGR